VITTTARARVIVPSGSRGLVTIPNETLTSSAVQDGENLR
jgi:hypothetical protein